MKRVGSIGNIGWWCDVTNLDKRHGRIELLPRICIMWRVLKVISVSWLIWDWTIEFRKLRPGHRERVREDIAMWRKHFPKEDEKKPMTIINIFKNTVYNDVTGNWDDWIQEQGDRGREEMVKQSLTKEQFFGLAGISMKEAPRFLNLSSMWDMGHTATERL